MEFLELLNKRQTCRSFINKRVESILLEKCIDAAILSPSSFNEQPWRFYVVTNSDMCSKMLLYTHPYNVNVTSYIVLTKAISQNTKENYYDDLDLGIAMNNIILQATEFGVATGFNGWSKDDEIRSMLNIPANEEVSFVISLGYTEEENRKKIRKQKSEVTKYFY